MKLFIISNEHIFNNNKNFFCDNIDLKTLPEELSKKFETILVARISKKERTKLINICNDKIKIFNKIFFYLDFLYKSFNKDNIYLAISITPYTFLGCILIYFRGVKPFLYLRSDGFKEYKIIAGLIGYYIYGAMYYFLSKFCNLISCEKKLLKNNKGETVYPSEIDDRWFANRTVPDISKPKILYVGRVRIEKGIFSLVDIISTFKDKIDFTVATSEKYELSPIKNTKIVTVKDSVDDLIKVYDDCNITILPSFTESYPKVIDESLSRLRPVIIFEEISHIINNRHGIFACKRTSGELLNIISFILKNYEQIRSKILNNNLSTKKNFVNKFYNILLKNI